MKVIIPLAGLGTRMRPLTHSQPKPLLPVAGKPMLSYILDALSAISVDEIIFVCGYLGDQIERYVRQAYPQYRTSFISQTSLLGQSHAIYQAKELAGHGELLILFADTIFKTDLATLTAEPADAVLHLQTVEDPTRFGVAVVDEAGWVQKLVEKPSQPVSNLAVVGVYYFKQAEQLFAALEQQITEGRQTKGEFYLADAFNLMLQMA